MRFKKKKKKTTESRGQARCAAGVAIVTAARRVPALGTLVYLHARARAPPIRKLTAGRSAAAATTVSATLPRSPGRVRRTRSSSSSGYTQHPSARVAPLLLLLLLLYTVRAHITCGVVHNNAIKLQQP